MNATITTYMPGDILFYSALPHCIEDTLITAFTSSSLVHVAIAISAIQKIEALNNGVMLTSIDDRHIATSWSYVKNYPKCDVNRLNRALVWLHQQIGQPYGWGDVAEAVLYKLEHNVTIEIGNHFDCSALALEFLTMCGINQYVTDVHIYTPAMLYKLLTT